jgi:hypothetical protein
MLIMPDSMCPGKRLTIWSRMEWSERLILHTRQTWYYLTFTYLVMSRDACRSLVRKRRCAFRGGSGHSGAKEKVTLQAVFLDWMERLGKYIDGNGVSVDWPKINLLERKKIYSPSFEILSHPRNTLYFGLVDGHRFRWSLSFRPFIVSDDHDRLPLKRDRSGGRLISSFLVTPSFTGESASRVRNIEMFSQSPTHINSCSDR